MKTLVLATGTCRNAPMLALEAEYYSRIPAPLRPVVKELPDGPTAAHTEAAQRKALQGVKGAMVVMLDETGQQFTSRAFAETLNDAATRGTKHLVFLIGGAEGLSTAIKAEAAWVMGLGKFTLPHQLVRVVLAEQLYRAHTLITGHPYHRGG